MNKKPTPTQPPSFSRKIKVLSFILGCCCMVAIIVNFINLHSDYEEVHEFYIGFMGRKMLIQERRLTSRSYLNMLRREHLLNVEVCNFQVAYSCVQPHKPIFLYESIYVMTIFYTFITWLTLSLAGIQFWIKIKLLFWLFF